MTGLNPHLATKAYFLVGRAVASGELARPLECSECRRVHRQIQGHHEDYAKPLDVVWLCPSCHQRRHRFSRNPYATMLRVPVDSELRRAIKVEAAIQECSLSAVFERAILAYLNTGVTA